MKRYVTDLSAWEAITRIVHKRFEKKTTPFMVIIKSSPKSWNQLAYLHSEILPKLTTALHDRGEIKNLDEDEAKYYLKVLIGFGKWISFRGSIVFDPHSFADASTEILSRAIDEAIKECEKSGIIVMPPKRG